MASINGITVKALKQFRGHEGEPLYQGNIYLGNKKIGWWSQDSWGGCDNIYLDQPYNITKLENTVKCLNLHRRQTFTRGDNSIYTLDYSLDTLFGDLMSLQEDEKEFKKAIKNGFAGLLLVTDGYKIFGWNLAKPTMEMSNEEILVNFNKKIEDGKRQNKFFAEDGYIKHEVKIYRSIDDFNVGRAINLNDIMR